MKATSPLCAKAVRPIMAINKTIIGNMWNFLFKIKNSNTSFNTPNLLIEYNSSFRYLSVTAYGERMKIPFWKKFMINEPIIERK